MSIDIPGELQWLGWIAGSDWPDGDEDKMWAIGDDWRTAAAELRDLLPDLRAAKKATIDAYPWGDGVEAMTKALDQLDHGPESLEHLAEILDFVAESADGLGTEIEYTKTLIISSLGMLAVEIAAAWLFPPTAPLAEALAVAATRVAVRLLGERAVSAIARFAAKTGIAALTKFAAKHMAFSTVLGAGQDLAIQAYQVGAGHRDDIDWNRVGATAYTAAAAGAVGGPVGSVLGKGAGRVPVPGGRFGDAFKGAVVGAGSGIAGGIGAWGIGGFANGWTWDPRILTSGGAYGVLVGGSKGFRHSPSAVGPGSHPFNAAEPGMPGGRDGATAPRAAGDGSVPAPRNTGESGANSHAGEPAGSSDAGAQRSGSSDTSGTTAPQSTHQPGSGDGSAPHRGTGTPTTGNGTSAANVRAGGPETRVSAGENRSAPAGDGTRAADSSSKPGETATQRPTHGESRRAGDVSRAGVPETRTIMPGTESGLSAGRRETPAAAAQPESATAQPKPEPAGAANPYDASARGTAAPADPVVPARDALRSLGVDPDGMGPRELERASAESAQSSATTRPAAESKPEAEPKPEAETRPETTRNGDTADALDPARERLRRLGVDPDGMSPERMRQAAEDAFVRKADEFADRTAALEGAGLRPDEFRVRRMELQKQIDDFLGLRRDLRADLPETRNTPTVKPETTTEPRPERSTPPRAGQREAESPASVATPANPRTIGEDPAPEGSNEPSHESTPAAGAFPDATSKIPYTPRYFGLPPIPDFDAAAPPPDSVWEPEPGPEPEPDHAP